MSLGQELAPHLPFLRRYARALTGSQAHGDAFVRATLEAIVAKPDEFPRDVDPRSKTPAFKHVAVRVTKESGSLRP